MSSFDYYFMERNGLWNEHCQEVAEKGRNDASPISRLIYACEIGDGIDQHASEDLKAVSAALAAMQTALEQAQKPCTWTQQEGEDCSDWETSCGDIFCLESGTPKENSIKFCPFCAHPVIEKAYEPPNWDDEE